MSSSPQAVGNAVISCIDAAYTNYELNLLDWQQVVEIGWRLLTKQDMGRFEEMCEEGLFRARGLWTLRGLVGNRWVKRGVHPH